MGEVRASAALEAYLKRHAAEVEALEARRRAEDEAQERIFKIEIARMHARFKGAEGRVNKAEAKVATLADSGADLRRKVHVLQRSIGRGEERLPCRP